MIITDQPIEGALGRMTQEVKQKLEQGWTIGLDDEHLAGDEQIIASICLEDPENERHSMTYKAEATWLPSNSLVSVQSYEVDVHGGVFGPWHGIESFGDFGEER